MSRNPREDLRKKRRRQRRQVEWEWLHEEWPGLGMSWWEAVANLQRFIERLPDLIVDWTDMLRIWYVVNRRIRNSWQAAAWWRV